MKTLKVLLEDRPDVFESQYGRATPLQKMSIDLLMPKISAILPADKVKRESFLNQIGATPLTCRVNFVGSDASRMTRTTGEMVCVAVNSCEGQACAACAGVNECNGQSRSIDDFPGNSCTAGDCDGQGDCSTHCPALGGAESF